MASEQDLDAAMVALLRESDARCPRCGYRLRRATTARCPECGEGITLEALTHRGRAAGSWVVTLAALAACLPESWAKWQRLLFKADGRIYYGDERFPWMSSSAFAAPLQWYDWVRCALSYAFWLGVPVAVVLLVVGHRRWATLPRWGRWGLAGAVALAVLLAYRRWMFWYWWWVADPQTGWPPGDLWWLRSYP